METAKRLQLVKEVGEEILTEEELQSLLEDKKRFIAYDGFEPSGTNVHIAQGLLRAININKMTSAGATFKMLVADWHAWANNKMNGDLDHIQTVGKYLIEVWKACDMDMEHVQFVWANDLMKDQEYLKTVMQIARNSTVKRITRCGQIMGRKDDDVQQASQIIYPCMQCADIFHLKADVTQLGMDQRKVNVLSRELGSKLGFWKPVVVSHHMLMGLSEPPKEATDAVERAIAMKMSKSNPNSAIFMIDTEEMITAKIKKAYCPEKKVEENPVLEYMRYIIFERKKEVVVERPAKFGGNTSYGSYAALEKDFADGKLHPMDLKQTATKELDALLEPVRKKLEKNATAQKLSEQIRSFTVTR